MTVQNTPWSPQQAHTPQFVCVTVDDEPEVRATLDMKLQEHPRVQTLHIFEDGELLVDFIQDSVMHGWHVGVDMPPPSVRCIVFLDIVLLKGNGEDVCRKLRERFADKLCIVAATSNVGDLSTMNYRRSGFDGVLSKLFTTNAVDMLLKHVDHNPHEWFVFN